MKILVLRYSSIGDIVLTTPIFRCLKQQLPGCQVHVATKLRFARVLQHNPHIDRFHFYDQSLPQHISELRAEGFDYVLDLHNNLRTRLVKAALGLPSSSFDKLNFEKWLLVNWKRNRMPHAHIVDRYLATAAPLGVVNDGKGLEFYIDTNEQAVADAALARCQAKPFAALVLGATYATKKLPHEKLAELLSLIQQPVVLLGGKAEAAEAEALVKAVNKPAYLLLNQCGELSLGQSAAVINRSERVYTHDTGLMHIAAALGKPCITFWGNTVPEFGMYPYQVAHYNAEVLGLPCRPCSKIGFRQCPQGHFRCMKDQNLAAAVQAEFAREE